LPRAPYFGGPHIPSYFENSHIDKYAGGPKFKKKIIAVSIQKIIQFPKE